MKNSPEALQRRKEKRRFWKATIDPSTIDLLIKKVCKDCKKEKDCHWNYVFTSGGKPEYRTRCVDCHKLYEKESRKRNRKSINKGAKLRKIKIKLRCIEYLGGSCAKCKEKRPATLTFHHRNPKEKDYTISQIKDWAWKRIKKELDKCTLLCFNCHMEIHHGKTFSDYIERTKSEYTNQNMDEHGQ